MRVNDLMTKDVSCCEPHSTLNEAARVMWDNDCGAVPVVDSNDHGCVIGMLTDRDIAMAAYTQGKRLGDIRVEQVMSKRLVTCKPDDTLESAERVMAEHQVRRLPVVDSDGCLIGLLSIAHLAREARLHNGSTNPRLAAAVGTTLSRICTPRRAVESASR